MSGDLCYNKIYQTNLIMKNEDFAVGLCIILFALFVGYPILAYIFMLLWNSVLVSIFGTTIINFWQSYGLILLLIFISNVFKR